MTTRPLDEKPGWDVQRIIDWVFAEGLKLQENNNFVEALALQLVANGAPVDRLMVSLQILHPQLIATSETWQRATGETLHIETVHEIRNSDRYIGSPMQAIYETEGPVRQRLDDLPEDAHLAYTEQADQGFTDYLGLPIIVGDSTHGVIIFSTCAPRGYTDPDIGQFEKLRDYLVPVLEMHALRQLARSLMNTYVGKRTGTRVLAGMIKRGDAEVINAALWFSDLRNFTELTETLPPEQLLEMLNRYFEFVAAAVGARGGEILRFIGDAMLIVFPIEGEMCNQTACCAAIESAIDARDTLASLNHQRRRHGQPPIEFGVGLNVGEVIYGNVGAPDRLDFTVMGPAVNRTARLESLTKALGRNILFSAEFADLIDRPVESLGEHAMKGIARPQQIYALGE